MSRRGEDRERVREETKDPKQAVCRQQRAGCGA